MSIDLVKYNGHCVYQVTVFAEPNKIYDQKFIDVSWDDAYERAREMEQQITLRCAVDSLKQTPVTYGTNQVHGSKFSSFSQIRGVTIDATVVRKTRGQMLSGLEVVPKLNINIQGFRKSLTVRNHDELTMKWPYVIELVCETIGVSAVPDEWMVVPSSQNEFVRIIRNRKRDFKRRNPELFVDVDFE